GCKDKPPEQAAGPSSSASAAASALAPELAAKVLAKVGEREITLGEYAATLARMDQFERMRYQTPDRRRKLLDEIIKAELLAGEAKRRGLDKKPEVEARIRQVLREEVQSLARAKLPPPASIPESDVRAYYDKQRAEFAEPERRRASHIVLADSKRAELVLSRARTASAAEWGKLVRESSLDKPAEGPLAPAELAGDLGIVSAPGDTRGANPKIPEAVRKALFEIQKLGDVYPEVVSDGGKFHIVRLTGKTEARTRSYEEAERAIRVAILQTRLRETEQRFERELRERYPVKIDEAALETVKVPPLGKDSDASGTKAP
ncbi:MAG TPA: peptidylprolyl isomerase, partial [Polyangiaceae bacterium]|nr:peptidylprolyl isomerase [Polyangiaceae bacterium]